jgi:hypothetical protein
MFLSKPNYRRTSVVTSGSQHEYRLKESFYLTKVEVRDKEDTEGELLKIILLQDFDPVLLDMSNSER